MNLTEWMDELFPFVHWPYPLGTSRLRYQSDLVALVLLAILQDQRYALRIEGLLRDADNQGIAGGSSDLLDAMKEQIETVKQKHPEALGPAEALVEAILAKYTTTPCPQCKKQVWIKKTAKGLLLCPHCGTRWSI